MKIFLIAKKLSHSFSRPIHNELADYSYEYKEMEEEELKGFFEKRDFDLGLRKAKISPAKTQIPMQIRKSLTHASLYAMAHKSGSTKHPASHIKTLPKVDKISL